MLIKNELFYTYEKEKKKVGQRAIQIQYLDNGILKTKSFDTYFTIHGPIMGMEKGKWLSLQENNRSLNALIECWTRTKSRSLADYTKAMELVSNNSNNTVYADAAGNIAYWHGNFMPKRNPNFDYTMYVDGSIKATDWQGVHPLNEIVQIKKHLIYWKDFKNRDSIITPIYDKYTVQAIKRFQKRHGLSPDGVIGQGTLKALNITQNERREQIYANLERWRWFPDDFGDEYLLINLPDYKLSYVLNNDTIAERRIVVGKPSRETPILSSKISNFVFNPTWTVPPTIIKEDLTPSALKNRNYFNRNRISIYDSKGQLVSPENWNSSKAKSYRYVQIPGYDNSLGLVKFNFPNRHSVYLHDTNHRDYFVREYRALSSGCVRIENPLQLSETILKKEDEKKWNKSEIDTIINRKTTRYIPLKNSNINIYLFEKKIDK